MNTSCRFCALSTSPESVVVGSVYIVPDAFPVTDGHHLVVPLRHCETFFDLTDEELSDTRAALGELRELLTSVGADGFNIGWNSGVSAGQTVGHAHCHFIPRRTGDVADPEGGIRGAVPGRQKYGGTRARKASVLAVAVL